MLAAVVVVFVILVAIGVHSCQVSADQSALKDYTNSVSSLISRSDETGASLFKVLSSGGGSGSAISLQNQINETRQTALNELSTARGLSAPDSVRTANANLQLAMQMRVDGITDIGMHIQSALGTTTSAGAIQSIATEMARFYASDVLYKDYTAPAIVSALHANGIGVGGTNGETINPGQFVPDIQWLTPSFIATKLNVSLPGTTSGGKPAPGLHGHALNSVSVKGTTLQTGSPNTVSATPPPTFTLNFTNGGTNNETDVVCKVTVNGAGISAQTVVPETVAGKPATCQVTLKQSPPAATYTVVATIEKVPGEKNLSNNSMSYTVTFG